MKSSEAKERKRYKTEEVRKAINDLKNALNDKVKVLKEENYLLREQNMLLREELKKYKPFSADAIPEVKNISPQKNISPPVKKFTEDNVIQAANSGLKDFDKKYISLLESGGSQRYKELLKPFNLDPSKSDFWKKGILVIEKLIDELENL